MLISICICTYNREYVLRYCLDALSGLMIPPSVDAEILVIDNNSSDNTSHVVHDFAVRSKISVRYIFEQEQGLSSARNRAIGEYNGQYLAFLDDECLVEPDWLKRAIADIKEFEPSIIGGPYVGAFLSNAKAPKWFKPEYGDAYFLNRKLGRGYQPGFFASGGNILLKRSVFSSLRFDKSLGMRGEKLQLGEEVTLQREFLQAHPAEAVFYDSELVVKHIILPHKMHLSYSFKRLFNSGSGNPAVRRSPMLKRLRVIIQALWTILVAPLKMVVRDRKQYPYWQNFVYELVLPKTVPVLGAAWGQVHRWYLSLRVRGEV